VRIHTTGNGAAFFVASDRPDPEFVHEPDFSAVHPRALEDTQAAFRSHMEVSREHGLVLTDNYNPVEFYDARNREAVRRHLALSARQM
jgi:hypothetical protein